MEDKVTDNIARLCMVCDHVLEDNEWVDRNIYEEYHKEGVNYSHGVCDDQNCKNAFEAYCVGDFKQAVSLKKQGRE